MGHTYTKKLCVVSLKFEFNCTFCILFGTARWRGVGGAVAGWVPWQADWDGVQPAGCLLGSTLEIDTCGREQKKARSAEKEGKLRCRANTLNKSYTQLWARKLRSCSILGWNDWDFIPRLPSTFGYQLPQEVCDLGQGASCSCSRPWRGCPWRLSVDSTPSTPASPSLKGVPLPCRWWIFVFTRVWDLVMKSVWIPAIKN